MRILVVNDILEWAIGGLSQSIERNNPHHTIKNIAIHPKDYRRDPEIWNETFKRHLQEFNPDVVHFQYWDTAFSLAPFVKCAKILTHHNQKNLLSHDWASFDALVCHTKKAQNILKAVHPNVKVIQHGIDLTRFPYKEDYNGEGKIGIVGRIVPWKNPEKILKVVSELGEKAIMMGRIDKGDVWAECQKYQDTIQECFGTPAEEQKDVYHKMSVYIGFSSDNIEEGTLGLLEAMACGIPVITTPAGEAADIIKDGENGILVPFDDEEGLKKGIERFQSMPLDEKQSMREKAWNTVKTMTDRHMAWRYEKVYYSVRYKRDLVSVIIPTFNRKEALAQILEAYSNQTYQPLEIVVCDDNSTDGTEEMVESFSSYVPIKYVNTRQDGYNLAMSRNMGIFAATGHYLVFNDDRHLPARDAVEVFIKRLSGIKEKSAVWGDKGAGRREFIENFFAIRRVHLVEAGMFNERINQYGGQSQDIRARLKKQNFTLEFEPKATATQIIRSKKSGRKTSIAEMKFQLWKLEN